MKKFLLILPVFFAIFLLIPFSGCSSNSDNSMTLEKFVEQLSLRIHISGTNEYSFLDSLNYDVLLPHDPETITEIKRCSTFYLEYSQTLYGLRVNPGEFFLFHVTCENLLSELRKGHFGVVNVITTGGGMIRSPFVSGVNGNFVIVGGNAQVHAAFHAIKVN